MIGLAAAAVPLAATSAGGRHLTCTLAIPARGSGRITTTGAAGHHPRSTTTVCAAAAATRCLAALAPRRRRRTAAALERAGVEA